MNNEPPQPWPSIVKILDSNKTMFGSGFLISADGYIITCHHVIYNLKSIHVGYQGKKYIAQWHENLSDLEVDIAIIKIDIQHAVPLQFSPHREKDIPVVVYGFTGQSIISDLEGISVQGILCQSFRVNTRATYFGFPKITESNPWNKKPSIDAAYLAYTVNQGVPHGVSGGPVLEQSTGHVIGIIQASRLKESYVIRWENMIDSLKQLCLTA